MKTEPLDFLLATLVMVLLGAIALGIAAAGSVGVSRPWLGAYHVLFDLLVFLIAYGSLSAVLCRTLLRAGLVRPGDFPMDDPAFRWWKLYTVTYEFGRGALLPVTTVFAKPLVAKMFGARIGGDIALGGHLVDPQFITIDAQAIVGQGSVITAHTITSGRLVLAPVRIGARATIGVNAVVMSGAEIGDGAVLTAGAVVPPGTRIPANELWGGVPARRLKQLGDEGADSAGGSGARRQAV